jgi:hypothetical protein
MGPTTPPALPSADLGYRGGGGQGSRDVSDCRAGAKIDYNNPMRVLPPFEEKIRHEIRDEMAKKPTLTMTALKEHIEKTFGRGFDATYIRKLTGKVRNEIIHDIDRATIEPRLAELRENYRVMREELLKIVYWNPETAAPGLPKPLARDRVEAAKSVVMLDLAVLNAEAAAGMFKKPVDALVKEFRYEPLPDEIRAVIIASWTRGGLLPAAAVEQMVPSTTAQITAQ